MDVEAFNYGLRDFTPSTYSKTVMQGSDIISFKTLTEAFINVKLKLEKQTQPTYIHVYFDKIDGVAHQYGPNSPQTDAEIETFLMMMQHYFDQIFSSKKRILFLMTADHGMCEVDPKTTVYLNTHKDFSGVEKFIRTNKRGHLIVPAGSARDMFMYIKPNMLEEAQDFLPNGWKAKPMWSGQRPSYQKAISDPRSHNDSWSGLGIWSFSPIGTNPYGGMKRINSSNAFTGTTAA